MSASVTMEASWGDGKPLAVLSDLVAKRVKYLNGETTKKAVTATAITVLTSIRAVTKVADPKKDKGEAAVAVDDRLYPSYRRVAGRSVPCARYRSDGRRERSVVCISFRISPTTRVYAVSDSVAGEGSKSRHYWIMADSKQTALDYAANRHAAHVAKYAGLARKVVGLLAHRIAAQGQDNVTVTAEAARVAGQVARVNESGGGTVSGSYSILVRDLLRYAALALRDGRSSLSVALMKAANSTAAKISKLGGHRLTESIPTPFPEAAGGKA